MRRQPAKLTPSEIALTKKFLGRLTPIPNMEREVFEAFWKARLAPMVTFELLIFESDPFATAAKKLPRVLLTYRDDEYYKGWHVPGGFTGGSETSAQAVRRILKRELNVESRAINPLFVLNRPHGSRDHHISIFTAVTLAKKFPAKKGDVEYFDPAKPPANLIPYYREAFAKLKKVHAFAQSLSVAQKKDLLKALAICEISGRMR